MATIKQLIDLDITDVQRMNRRELAAVVSTLSSAANKRLARLERSDNGELSPAYQQAQKRGQRFSVKGKNVNQLRNEYKAVTQFLKRETSTVGGWKKVRKETYSRIGGDFASAAQEKRFWKAYRKLASDEYGAVKSYGSTETQRLLRQEIVQGGRRSMDDIIETMISHLDEEYEKQQNSLYGEDFDDYDTGDFFTIGDEDI